MTAFSNTPSNENLGDIDSWSYDAEAQPKVKEQDFSNNLFWLDYVARQYDPTRGQFTTPDPLAEMY